jgi:hypothetical protein
VLNCGLANIGVWLHNSAGFSRQKVYIAVKLRILFTLSVLAALLASGCAGTRTREAPAEVVITPATVASSFQVVDSVQPHLDDLDAEFRAFPRPSKLGRDYYNAAEIDALEGLLFRFLAMQTTLWDIVNEFGGLDAKFPDDELDAKAQVLSIAATLLIAEHTAFVVAQFADEPLAIKQINESYYRSEIPFGTYDRMRENATLPGLLAAVADAKELYGSELADPQSSLSALAGSDPKYAALIREMPALHDQAEQRLHEVAKYFPSYAEAEKLAKKDAKGQHKTLYAIRSWLFKEVSRLKSPSAHVVVFTDEQKRQIFGLLEPGDLVLTYTAGYMSDVFIPGAFKHGITYIGTPDDRMPLGLSADTLPADERFEPEELSANLQKSSLPDGTSADMIEAVAEGVIFNDLEHIMDTHVNRMLILRPKLTEAERAQFLLEVYSYLGDGYDFRFDFADASQQVCTEVIYRAINGKGAIDFELVMRAGHETLSADDIANYHLDPVIDAFEFVLLVETDPDSKTNAALVFTGAEGEARLMDLMQKNKEQKPD